ncbi:4713_t:CDS:2 [Funneliformis geosporum]|uniref:4713_t:CDS:1 n=1 Tax=Funneliformis geosporum TaxID=1117311 RepID=A0A9W4SZG8_9GLOM|nr:4713_t:CDS:2 [Funneliformis geosporum]
MIAEICKPRKIILNIHIRESNISIITARTRKTEKIDGFLLFFLYRLDIDAELGYLFLRANSFTPKGRIAHSSILHQNMIYIFGGYYGNSCTNEVFHLDIYQNFNAEYPQWTENSAIGFESCWATTVITHHNNNPTIYLIGGIMQNQNFEDSFASIIYTYSLSTRQWNIPVTVGKLPERRRDIQAVADHMGNIYIFGGVADKYLGSEDLKFFNDMVIFNADYLTWSYGPIVNAPLKRHAYTATLLSSGMIVYIGGREQTDNGNLRENHVTVSSLLKNN